MRAYGSLGDSLGRLGDRFIPRHGVGPGPEWLRTREVVGIGDRVPTGEEHRESTEHHRSSRCLRVNLTAWRLDNAGEATGRGLAHNECGWIGLARESSGEAFKDAYDHDLNVSEDIKRPVGWSPPSRNVPTHSRSQALARLPSQLSVLQPEPALSRQFLA